MYSELIVIFDTGQKEMDLPWRTLERSHGGQLFRLIDMVLIRRDKSGQVSFQMRWQESDRLINHHMRLGGDFAEAIFGRSSVNGHRRLVEAGLDPFFLQDVVQALQPNRSAYLFYVPGGSPIDVQRYIESLERLQGDLYHTTFRQQVEEALLKQKG